MDIEDREKEVKIQLDNEPTLRDIFASKAISNMISYKPKNMAHWVKWFFGYTYQSQIGNYDDISRNAYALADEMLKARLK